jgi:hypothetical protein
MHLEECKSRRTEGEVLINPVGGLHVVDRRRVEIIDFILRALSTAVIVLTRKLSDPNRQVESVVPELKIVDEALSSHVIVVNSDVVVLDAAVMRTKKDSRGKKN